MFSCYYDDPLDFLIIFKNYFQSDTFAQNSVQKLPNVLKPSGQITFKSSFGNIGWIGWIFNFKPVALLLVNFILNTINLWNLEAATRAN